MSRISRKSYETGFFHVIVQGYEKQYIFKEEQSKKVYLDLLLSQLNNYNIELLAYCIMDNHAHMLVYAKEIPELSNYMRIINTKFALYYNRSNDRVGYVFRDRFLSEPIEDEKYLYKCLSYIHNNPVKANMVEKLGDYRYSSYNSFLNKTGIVTDNVLIRLFGDCEQYLKLFEIIHSTPGEGMEYSKDTRIQTYEDSAKIINDTLHRFAMKDLDLNNTKMMKFFFELFIQSGAMTTHIEKHYKIDHRKIKSLLS